MNRLRLVARVFVAILFVTMGILHFTSTSRFVDVMPPFLGWKGMLVLVSGVFEILGGVAMLAPMIRLRRLAAFGLVALLLSVFIVNIDMALVGSPMRDGTEVPGGRLLLLLRLPLQFALIWLVLFASREDVAPELSPSR